MLAVLPAETLGEHASTTWSSDQHRRLVKRVYCPNPFMPYGKHEVTRSNMQELSTYYAILLVSFIPKQLLTDPL